MTLKNRRFLFYGLLFLFIITGSAIVFYSQGWRINFGNCPLNLRSLFLLGEKRFSGQDCKIKFQKTGAIFIATRPQGVTIKVDGKYFKDKSGLMQGGTLIANLPPKNYRVFVSKDGYEPWEKDFRVLPEFVAEARKIVLVPKEIVKEQIPVKRFRGDRFLGFSSDGSKFITEDTVREIYYLYDLNNLDSVFNINVNFQNLKKDGVILKLAFHPFDSDKLIIEIKSGLYILDVARITLHNLSLGKPLLWTVSNPNIYYVKELKNPGLPQQNEENIAKYYALTSFNLVVKTQTATYDLLIGEGARITDLAVSNSQSKIAYSTNLDDLYVLNLRDKSIKKIAHNAGLFAFSPDSKKIAFLDNGCGAQAAATVKKSCFSGYINIYFIEDGDGNPAGREGERITLYPKNIVSIENIAWYRDSTHLLIQYFGEDKKQRIDFVETDDRPPLNQQKLIGDASSFYYDARLTPVYYLLKNELYSFEIEK